MLGDKQKKPTEIGDVDALDTLRRWIKINHFEFGSLKPTLIIQKGMVEVVKLEQGDVSLQLKAGELLND